MTQEEEIKHYFLPYQVHLKITRIGEHIDNEEMIPEIPVNPSTGWKALSSECVFDDIPQKDVPNTQQSQQFTKNDCPPNGIPSTVTYTVPAGTYLGYNLDEANLYALEDIANNGQAYANANGTCTIILEELLFTTNNSVSNTAFQVWFNQWSGDIGQQVNLVVKKGSTIIKDQQVVIGGSGPITFDLEETDVQVYVKGEQSIFSLIKELSIDGVTGTDWGVDSVFPEIFPNLTKFNVSGQKSLTSVDLSQNLELDRVEIYENNITGHLDVSMLSKLFTLDFFNNNVTTLSSMTNHPQLTYFNATGNGLTGTLNFTGSPDIELILASQNNLTNININNRQSLIRLECHSNPNLTQAFDFTTCPNLEVFGAENSPLTGCIFENNNKIRGFFVANNTIPESHIVNGINANKATLEAISIQAMAQLVNPLNFDNCPNLHFIWVSALPNCTGISFNNSNNITNLNISGMNNLSSLPNLGTNPLNAFVWVTGTGIGPSDVDAILNHISALNIPPIQEHPVGPGGIIYGDYQGVVGSITPTSASLAAYNDLLNRGYTIIGPVPGS